MRIPYEHICPGCNQTKASSKVDQEKLAKILAKLEITPHWDFTVDAVWQALSPEIRNRYRDRAVLVIYMLGEEAP